MFLCWSMGEIKSFSKYRFRNINREALEYLTKKQGSKLPNYEGLQKYF